LNHVYLSEVNERQVIRTRNILKYINQRGSVMSSLEIRTNFTSSDLNKKQQSVKDQRLELVQF